MQRVKILTKLKNRDFSLRLLIVSSFLIAVTAQAMAFSEPQKPLHAAHHAMTIAQKTSKSSWSGFGVTVIRAKDGMVTVDGHPAALDEENADARVFSEGLNTVIFYTKGRVVLMREGLFLGDLK